MMYIFVDVTAIRGNLEVEPIDGVLRDLKAQGRFSYQTPVQLASGHHHVSVRVKLDPKKAPGL
jgi:hypothetical protein